MSHLRHDSANMTHSTRRSYREKYLEAQQNVGSSAFEHAKLLAEFSEYQAVAENERKKLHDFLQQAAEATSDLVAMLDSRDGQLGFKVKDIRKPIDSNLPAMDGQLIARRIRDVTRHATTRIGMAGLGLEDLRQSLSSLTTGVSLLQPPLLRAQNGYLESYVIGRNPTEKEVEEAKSNRGKNPRTLSFSYDTDNSDSESEDEANEKAPSALVPTSPARVAKPAGRTPAARRITNGSTANAIDIS